MPGGSPSYKLELNNFPGSFVLNNMRAPLKKPGVTPGFITKWWKERFEPSKQVSPLTRSAPLLRRGLPVSSQ